MGMIEVVPYSKTTAEIQKESGGALGALKEEVLWAHLKGHNPRSDQQALVCCLPFYFGPKLIFFLFFAGKTNFHSILCCFLCNILCHGDR